MKVKNAIIVHGPGRSGTTLLSNILATHEAIGWLSNYVNKYPNLPQLTVLNKFQESDVLERWSRGKKKFPRPSEAYNFWLHHVPEFNDAEVPEISKASTLKIQKQLAKVVSYTNKDYFLTKITGYSRHQTLNAVFEDPKIIWIERNSLSVIASYYKLRWGYKDKPELFEATEKKALLKKYTEKYNAFQADKSNLSIFAPLTVHYEDLVADKHAVLKKICEFSEVPYTQKFKNKVEDWQLAKNTNEAYKTLFSEDDIKFIESLLR